MKLFRPVKWKEGKEWRLTQPFWTLPGVYWPMWFKGHMGLDYAWQKPWDTIPVYSATKWIVDVRDSGKKWYGKHVVVTSIIDGKPYEILYGHLSKITVKDNQEVNIFDEIGIMGNTWFSSGVHLHFEIKDPAKIGNGYKGRFDPMPFICDWDSTGVSPYWDIYLAENGTEYQKPFEQRNLALKDIDSFLKDNDFNARLKLVIAIERCFRK